MTKPQRVELTDTIRTRIAAVERALDRYVPGLDSSADVEIPKLALADALLAQLARVPRPRPVKAQLAGKRRQRA